MNTAVVSIDIDEDLAIVTIDNPLVDTVSHAIREGLAEAITKTNDNHQLRAVLLRCGGTVFVADADAGESGNQTPQAPDLPDIISDIENARIPWLAVVHGTVLSQELELTLGCRYRIADENSSFGFPEVNMGLIPGAGGTVRLPRLITMLDALNLITSGSAIDAFKAKSIGLIDELVSNDLLTSAKAYARAVVVNTDRLPLYQLPVIEPLGNEQIEKATAVSRARRQFAKTAAIETIAHGADISVKEAMLLEHKTFQKLRISDQAKALRHLFFAERSVSEIPELENVMTRAIEVAGIVGGGTMGTGIASSALLSGLKVIMIERDNGAIKNAQSKIENILNTSHSRGLISQDKHDSALNSFSISTQYSSLHNADIVIEAVFEDMDVKKEVFRRLDKVTKPEAILASNTSYLDISAIANLTTNPSRVVGLHYFSPAHIMKLLEVIRTDVVAPDVLASALLFAKRTGKIPVPTGNCHGFIGNRIMSAYRKTCEYLLEDGALPHEVDSAMRNFGFPLGIFEMQDLAGLDIGWAMRKQLSPSHKSETRYVAIADKICEMGRFGRKTGSGYYNYTDGKTAERDEWVEELIRAESERKGIARRTFSEAEIISSILERLTDEANAILKEGIADSADAIDVVMVNGFGFPRWLGGPMYLASIQNGK